MSLIYYLVYRDEVQVSHNYEFEVNPTSSRFAILMKVCAGLLMRIFPGQNELHSFKL